MYEDRPWIKELLELVREIHGREIRRVGGCFGHQAVALDGQPHNSFFRHLLKGFLQGSDL